MVRGFPMFAVEAATRERGHGVEKLTVSRRWGGHHLLLGSCLSSMHVRMVHSLSVFLEGIGEHFLPSLSA